MAAHVAQRAVAEVPVAVPGEIAGQVFRVVRAFRVPGRATDPRRGSRARVGYPWAGRRSGRRGCTRRGLPRTGPIAFPRTSSTRADRYRWRGFAFHLGRDLSLAAQVCLRGPTRASCTEWASGFSQYTCLPQSHGHDGGQSMNWSAVLMTTASNVFRSSSLRQSWNVLALGKRVEASPR